MRRYESFGRNQITVYGRRHFKEDPFGSFLLGLSMTVSSDTSGDYSGPRCTPFSICVSVSAIGVLLNGVARLKRGHPRFSGPKKPRVYLEQEGSMSTKVIPLSPTTSCLLLPSRAARSLAV